MMAEKKKYTFFKVEPEQVQEKKAPEIEKEKCPFCLKLYSNLSKHEKTCLKNPENQSMPQTQQYELSIVENRLPYSNELVSFCEIFFKEDDRLKQFVLHSISRSVLKTKYKKKRGGGGWSGTVLRILEVMNKMRDAGIIEFKFNKTIYTKLLESKQGKEGKS